MVPTQPGVPRAERGLVRPRCSVRGCGARLERGARAWRCARGHSFDVARSGYVNLLQASDRRSREPGDAAAAVAARARLDEAGVGAVRWSIARELLARHPAPGAVLDVGAGSGWMLERLRALGPGALSAHSTGAPSAHDTGAPSAHDTGAPSAHGTGGEAWALELSRAAAERGARRHPRCVWVVANADRGLPFEEGCFALVLSCAGPRNAPEFARVLAPGGRVLLVLPGPEDLVELRAAVLGEGRSIERTERALAPFAQAGLEVLDRGRGSERRRLGAPEIADVLAATYRGARARERERAAALLELEVTFEAEAVLLGRSGE